VRTVEAYGRGGHQYPRCLAVSESKLISRSAQSGYSDGNIEQYEVRVWVLVPGCRVQGGVGRSWGGGCGVGAGVMAGMGGGGAARTAGNSEELAVEWDCAVGAASGDWGSGCAGDAVVANAFKSFGLG
jgi:hypothetical protein